MALGGVATGSIKAKDVAMVTGIIKYSGFTCKISAWNAREENLDIGTIVMSENSTTQFI